MAVDVRLIPRVPDTLPTETRFICAFAVARRRVFSYLQSMEVHFSPDLQARLTQRATEQRCNLEEAVQDVVARYFEEEERFVEAVRQGEAALDRGEFLTHEEVGERLRRFLQP
jgi:predicted transcriptional regulator